MKKIWRWVALIVGIRALLLCIELYRSSHQLTVANYQLQNEKLTDSIRVVHLTDLHNARFGRDNADLLAKVARQGPDLILFTGDLVTGHIQDTETARALLQALAELAPVYVSIGNHEQMHEQNFGTGLTELFTAAGATVLEYGWEDIEIKGQRLRIGGTSSYCVPGNYLSTGEADPEECAFLENFQDTGRCTLLMAHMPVSWIRNKGIRYWDVDFVFSGHAHAGQVVLPGLGGVYAPDMGFFPGRLEGIFSSRDGQKHLILSPGLGNSSPIPRFNNPPQILVLDILP